MDDYSIVLGMEFFDNVKVMPILLDNTMCIMGEESMCMVTLPRETNMQVKKLSNGMKKAYLTYIVILKEESKSPLWDLW